MRAKSRLWPNRMTSWRNKYLSGTQSTRSLSTNKKQNKLQKMILLTSFRRRIKGCNLLLMSFQRRTSYSKRNMTLISLNTNRLLIMNHLTKRVWLMTWQNSSDRSKMKLIARSRSGKKTKLFTSRRWIFMKCKSLRPRTRMKSKENNMSKWLELFKVTRESQSLANRRLTRNLTSLRISLKSNAKICNNNLILVRPSLTIELKNLQTPSKNLKWSSRVSNKITTRMLVYLVRISKCVKSRETRLMLRLRL